MKASRVYNEYILAPFFDKYIPEEDFVSFETNLLKNIDDFHTKDIVVGYYDEKSDTAKIFDNYDDDRFTKDQFASIIKNLANDSYRESLIIFRDIEFDTISYFMIDLIYQDIYKILNVSSHVCKEFGKKIVLGYIDDIDVD